MNYADTRTGQRVAIVAHRHYPDRFVGQVGTITERYDGVDTDHGTVEVKLDGEFYLPPTPGWGEFTHMGVDQLTPQGL